MGFGDSITIGDFSSDDRGYRGRLEDRLIAHFGRASVPSEGMEATKSNFGADHIDDSLGRVHPAYTLILYGTNDWNEQACQARPPADCYTLDALRSMILQCKDAQSFPVLGTIPPVNPNYPDKSPTERNAWVKGMNDLLRTMAQQQNAPVADIYDAFIKKGAAMPGLFSDDIHPNEGGYALMAQVWLKAIVQPIGTSTSSRGLPNLFLSPGGF